MLPIAGYALVECRRWQCGTLAVLLLMSPSIALAQPVTYTPVIPASTPTPSSMFTATSGTCKEADGSTSGDNEVPDGGFIKANTSLKTDVWVITGGTCEVRIWGSFYGYQYHHVSPVRVEQLTLGADPANDQNWNPGYFNLYTPAFVLNSIPGTNPNPNAPPPDNTTPAVSLGVNAPGEHRFRYKTFADTTGCAFPTSSAFDEKTLNAVACLPNWKLDADGNLAKFPTDQHIKVVYPTSLKTPVENLVGAWNTRLALTGVTLDEVENGTCAASDEYCIIVDTIAQCPVEPLVCGCSRQGDPVNGVYTTASKIWIRNTTGSQYSWTDSTRQYTLGHEFGHLFGLGDSSCSAGSTLMTSPASCGQPLGSDTNTPTASDGVPVTKAVYGNAPRKTCGW